MLFVKNRQVFQDHTNAQITLPLSIYTRGLDITTFYSNGKQYAHPRLQNSITFSHSSNSSSSFNCSIATSSSSSSIAK